MNSTAATRRSRLTEYVETAAPAEREKTETRRPDENTPLPSNKNSFTHSPAAELAHARRELATRVGEFRRTAVLVPLDEHDVPLTGDYGGVRWIYAFSDETALARYALARGEGDREWAYQRWLGARLLDAAVPAVGVPCGVALDVGGRGTLFPPVAGIVPDRVAVDVSAERGDAK
ncbi:hypothetical protein HEP81_02990 [Streptomyces griseofuscus]|uniref:SseB protein N-terminal domain-containing protein n=1 Tax=Streptomyces griseofuscus TaxID=146922 RepID=A0A7H1PZ24_9ACTN|nr:hypothetical protein [Streptomyces griseofuscus]QNT93304.1 hypothetical protein HEP81_02990 [Streptomyces griseofuscus]